MKVSRSFALDLEDMQLLDDVARELKVSQNHALTLLIRHGSIRMKQLDVQMSQLAPSNEDLR